LNGLSIVSLSVAAICAAIVIVDVARHPQEMPIMNWVWPIAEFAIFFTGLTILGSTLAAEFVGDYILAYAFGIAFQFFAIVPMRHLSLLPGLQAAVKADTFSLTACDARLSYVLSGELVSN
jgi:Domain of unknown function (DUF4396)